MKIKDIKAFSELSSMGNTTIRVDMTLENGITSSIGVPFGISAGKYEAQNVPANEALAQIESVKNNLLSGDWEQNTLDKKLVEMNLSGNASIALSVAFWRGTVIVGQDLHYEHFPKLCVLLFEGGKHGNSKITLQEFMLVEDSLEQAVGDSHKMREYLVEQKIGTTVGAEGGFSPIDFTTELVLQTIKTVFPDRQIAIDAAGSFQKGEEEYEKMLESFNIFYLEDFYSDEDWEKWIALCKQYGTSRLIVGDDLTVTNSIRLKEAIEKRAVNAIIIKPNQNGTISGALETVKLAREHNIKVVVSHRGEETNDDWIVDFALFIEADYVKFGGMNRGERIAKYNRLLHLGMK